MSAPTGLELFKATFAEYGDQYVLIGGTATHLAMAAAGLDFRNTRDLDIVLIVECDSSRTRTPSSRSRGYAGKVFSWEGILPPRFSSRKLVLATGADLDALVG